MWTSVSYGNGETHGAGPLRAERDAQLLLSTLESMVGPFPGGTAGTELDRNVTMGATAVLNGTAELLERLLPTATVAANDSYGLHQPAGPLDGDSLAELYGPKRDPLYVVIPITIVYLLIFLSGVVGNISTCIVIARNRSMHTATNYYLFSLAVSDFLLLVSGVPQEIYFIWSKYPYVFGETFCVLRGIAAETSANATVLTITAFTVERYVAICHPFLSHTMSKLSRAIRFIFGIWLIAILSAVPQALQFGVTSQGGIDQCVVKRIIIEHSFELSTFLFFFAPMTLITVLYALIGLKLRSSTLMQRDGTLQRRNNVAASSRQSTANSQGTRRVLKMLVAVVVAFFICWAPFHAQRLVYIYGVDKDHQPSDPLILQLFIVTTYISGILYYLSTCINPLLYNIMSNKFREAFKETLAACCQIARQSNSAEQSYRILPRRERRPAANKESSDVSGNSFRDESLYSSSTQKQSLDSITLSRCYSLKRPPSSGGGHAGSEVTQSMAGMALGSCYQPGHHHHHHQHHHHHHHYQQGPAQHGGGWSVAAAPAAMVAEGTEGRRMALLGTGGHRRPDRTEFEPHTQAHELQLHIRSAVPGEQDDGEGAQRQLAHISIHVNRRRAEERSPLAATPSVPEGARGRQSLRRSVGDPLRLLSKQPRGQDGRVELFVRGRQYHRQRGRVRLWRFFQQQVRRLRGPAPASGALVRFHRAPQTPEVSRRSVPIERPEAHGARGYARPFRGGSLASPRSCGNSSILPGSRYFAYPGDCATGSTLEDDLDAYMREIKLRETTIS